MTDEQANPSTARVERSRPVREGSETDEVIKGTLKALKRNGFAPHFAADRAAARETMLEMISPEAVVGVGDSTTLRQIGVFEALAERGQHVINPFTKELTLDPANHPLMQQTLRRAFGNDLFITGTNAVTLDGILLSTDRVGNRLAGMIFGAPRVILVVSQNKIVRNVEEALRRIKDVIAPAHAGWKGRKTPCAATGNCNDCDSPDRICRITVIIEKKPQLTEMAVILVAEDLGLGWDPLWPRERIEAIRSRYQEVTWNFPAPQ